MPDLNWTVIGEIEASANWLSTNSTSANLFRFEHHNPPKKALLHVAQTDGLQWLFEPRTLSSDRNTQLLFLDQAAIFGGQRRLSVRFADPSLTVRNWTVKIAAATIASPDLASLATIVEQLTALQQTQTQMAVSLEAIRTVLNYPTPTPTPTPIPGTPRTYQSVGDTNGVFYWLGTRYGAETNWYNPQAYPISVVRTVLSSIEYGYVESATDRLASGLLFSDNAPGQWIAFDLGAGNTLSPNYYTLRHHSRSDGDYLRSFKLQGSNNAASNSVADLSAATWTDLDVRVGDTQINGSDAWGGWAISGVTTPYRWLRILQTAANAGGRHYLVCGEVEFYGTFRR